MADQIIQVIDALCEKFGIVIDWSAESLTPAVYELVDKYAIYVLASSMVYIAIYIVMVALGVKAFKLVKSNPEFASDSVEASVSFALVVAIYTVSMIVFSMALMFDLIPNLIQAITFPELLLINEVMSYIK